MEKMEILVSGRLDEIANVDHSLLKEAVSRSDNFAMILMHPYYHGYRDNQDREFDSLLSDLLKSEKDDLPIFIFEDNPAVRKYSSVEGNSHNRFVCMVPTHAGAPHPIIGWDKLVDIFKEVGIKDLVMAGKYLTYQEENDGLAKYQTLLKGQLEKQGLNLDRTLAACVGISAGVLAQNDFNIHLSELSRPLKLSDFT